MVAWCKYEITMRVLYSAGAEHHEYLFIYVIFRWSGVEWSTNGPVIRYPKYYLTHIIIHSSSRASLSILPVRSTVMLSQPTPSRSSTFSHNADPLVTYSRSLHDYTLRLWTESRRVAEEKAQARVAEREAEQRTHNDLPQNKP